MRILVIGSGGREHALVWKLAQKNRELYCAPGNAGISRLAVCVDIAADNHPALTDFALEQRIDLTVVGPEAPLCAGIVDDFVRRGLPIFGPRAEAAQLEGNKVFAKQLMEEMSIPTARFAWFREYEKARGYLSAQSLPLVIKAAGLAAGKGAVVCNTREEAEVALRRMMVEGELGKAGRTVLIEEFLQGEEFSAIALCDGTRLRMCIPSQDHKRLLDHDQGPNTGGMGAYAPVPAVSPELSQQVEEIVFKPLLAGLLRRGIVYRGVIYAGMILTEQGPKVLEFNCRFGDPETQAILPLLESDLGEILAACAMGDLSNREFRWSQNYALCVVAASRGYPGRYEKGLKIRGDLEGTNDILVFHAGTAKSDDSIVTAGGRVLGVTGIGKTLSEARDKAYKGISRISFPGMHYRQDIGWRGLVLTAQK